MTPTTKTLCIFCGSNPGTDVRFEEAAKDLGRLIAEKKYDVVYGGGTIGLMGAVARSAIEHGGRVHGIIPQAIVDAGIEGENIMNHFGERTIVSDMHTRKQIMGHKADAFIALPGGYGTMEELFEVITWSQLGIHGKPIVILNTAGYYDGILGWVNRAIRDGFVEDNGEILVEAKYPAEVLKKIESYKLPQGRYNLNWSGLSPVNNF